MVKKEFTVVLAIALSFTLLYLLASYALWLDVPDAVRVASECIGILVPIILLISWYMCIERYVAIMYNLRENKGNKRYLVQVVVRIILLIIGGINVYRSILNVMIYPFNSLKDYMDDYNVCFVIKIFIAVAWIAFLIYNFAIGKITDASKRSKLILAIILLAVILLGTEVAGEFISECSTQAWMRKMNEVEIK